MQPNLSQFILCLVCFALGSVFGYTVHDLMKKSLQASDEINKNFLLAAVTIIWVISMVISLVNTGYQTPAPVHGLMGIVVGFFFYNKKKE